MAQTRIGLQLYTVRDAMERDFEGTLKRVAELGYQGVEFAGFYGRTPEQVKDILTETGLVALGAHTPYVRLRDALDEEIAFNKKIGNRYLVCPFLEETDRNWEEVIEHLKVIGQRCAEEDMVLFYHNHEFELTETLDGQPVLDAIYSRVPADVLKVELDSCWVSYAGYNPLEYITEYKNRLPLLHLKDMITRPDGSAETVALGKGEVPIKEIADTALAIEVEWLIAEQDNCGDVDPLECIATSMNWIKDYAKNGGKINV